MALDSSITISNYTSTIMVFPTNTLKPFFLKTVNFCLTKFKWGLIIIRQIIFLVCRGTFDPLELLIETDHLFKANDDLFKNVLIHYANSSEGSSPSDSNLPPLPIHHEYYSDGESITDTGRAMSQSPVDPQIDISISNTMYLNNSLNGQDEKAAYYNRLTVKKDILMRELSLLDDNVEKRIVMNRSTHHILGEIIEMRNRTHAVILLCHNSSSFFHEIHIDSSSQSNPISWMLTAGLHDPLNVQQIPLKTLLIPDPNSSPRELAVIEQEENRRKIVVQEDKTEGFFKYFYSFKEDFNKLSYNISSS